MSSSGIALVALSVFLSSLGERKPGRATVQEIGRHASLCCCPWAGRAVPLLGVALQKPFREYLEAQKAKLHHHAGEGIPTEESWLSWLFEKIVVIMVCFFVCSIVNSMAQSFAKRRQQQEKCAEGKME